MPAEPVETTPRISAPCHFCKAIMEYPNFAELAICHECERMFAFEVRNGKVRTKPRRWSTRRKG